MNYKNIVLYSDMDGTLLNSEGRMSPENRSALLEYMAQGGLFGIATGRSQLNAIGFLEDVKVNIPCILYNGGGFYDFEQEKFLSYEQLKKEYLVNFLEFCIVKHPSVMIQIFTPQISCFVSRKEYADDRIVEIHRPCSFGSLKELLEEPWIKVLLCATKAELVRLEQVMLKLELRQELEWVYSSETYLELLPAGVTKGSALKKARKYLKEACRIYAVGDFYNDIEMIQEADVGIAVQNAVAPLKEMAELIIVNNDDSAIADIINHIMKDNCV